MKNFNFLLLSLLAISLAFGFQSCDKDKDENPSNNTENTTGNGDVNNISNEPVSPTFTFSSNFNEKEKSIEMGEELSLTIANINSETKVSASLDGNEIELNDGIINLPTSDLGKYKLNVVINSETYKFTYNVVPVTLDFKSAPTLSKSEAKFGGDLSVNVKTNLTCNVTLKIGDSKISSTECEGEVSITIPTVFKVGDYTATIIVSDGTTTKQSDISFKIGLPDFVMVKVEGGTFNMGATQEQDAEDTSFEKPVHSVTLSLYSIGQTEVTQALWYAVMGENPSGYTEKNADGSVNNNSQLPVENVSWNDVQTFLTDLNKLAGKTFRLPTEAEWEFAARGGNKSKGYIYSGSNNIDKVAWYTSSYYKHGPTKVGSFDPNELGIYDMSGNVSELCQDWYRKYSSSSQTNPTGPVTGSDRVSRGGHWYGNAWYCRVSYRGFADPDDRDSRIGFRLAL